MKQIRITLTAAFLLGTTLLLGACCCNKKAMKENSTETTITNNGAVVNATATLDQGTWVLKSMRNKKVTYAKDQSPVTLFFNPEANLLGGHSGVNRYNGSYSIVAYGDGTVKNSDSQAGLKIGDLLSTKMAGPTEWMQLEDSYLATLSKVDNYQVSAYELLLRQGEKILLTFERQENDKQE